MCYSRFSTVASSFRHCSRKSPVTPGFSSNSRIAGTILHPTIFTHEGANLPGEMLAAFCVCLAGMLSLAGALYLVELSGKRIDASLRELRELLA